LKILQLSSAQALGGGERHLADLANALAARGHEVHAILRPRSPLIAELTEVPRANIAALSLRNALDAVSARKLARYVREHKIQIVHAHMARDYPLASYAAARHPGCKLVLTRHVLFPLNRLHSVTLSQVARVIAVSEAVASQLRAQGLISTDRIVMIPNGINTDKFALARSPADRQDFRRHHNFPDDCLLIGTVGEITKLKGHDDFLKAASIILRRLPQARFLIAGLDASRSGANQVALERQIAELGLGNQVQQVGWIDDLASLYGALDIFVSASHTESFGLVIAEAMASGTPVVATATAGASEIITHEENGLLVPVGDVEGLAAAQLALLTDIAKSSHLATSAWERIREHFSLDRMVEETEKIYREVIDN
jgi:glycosyltransferase involved in cell wall biosynthesis